MIGMMESTSIGLSVFSRTKSVSTEEQREEQVQIRAMIKRRLPEMLELIQKQLNR
jgi:hypothetical protein